MPCSRAPASAAAVRLRINATSGRDVEHIGPFIASFTEHTANPYLSYAIPLDGGAPTDDDVRALVDVFRRRGRVPRLEYFPGARAPGRAAAGRRRLHHRAPHPLMACTPPDLRPIPVPDGVAVRLPAASVQHKAYEELGPAGPDDAARLRRLAEGGGVVVIAVVEATGGAAGAGVCDAIHHGLGELTGIGS